MRHKRFTSWRIFSFQWSKRSSPQWRAENGHSVDFSHCSEWLWEHGVPWSFPQSLHWVDVSSMHCVLLAHLPWPVQWSEHPDQAPPSQDYQSKWIISFHSAVSRPTWRSSHQPQQRFLQAPVFVNSALYSSHAESLCDYYSAKTNDKYILINAQKKGTGKHNLTVILIWLMVSIHLN